VDAAWPHLGLMYAQVAKKCGLHDIYKEACNAVFDIIRRDQNVLEVYSPKSRPYRSLFYHADEGMLWGSAIAKLILRTS
jgi:hypothetical protein